MTTGISGINNGLGGGTVLFSEGFEDANLGNRGWYDLTSIGISTVEHTSTGSGSLQWAWALNGTSPSPAGHARHLFTPTDTVYVRYWVKHSANWIGSGQTFDPHLFHVMTTLDDSFVGPAWTHLTMYIEENYSTSRSGSVGRMEFQDAANIDTGSINVDLTHITENRAIGGCNGNPDNNGVLQCFNDGGTPPTWFNGTQWDTTNIAFSNVSGSANYQNIWHKVEVFFKMNSIANGKAVNDGLMQYSLDGVLMANFPNIQLRTGAHPTMQFNQFMMAPFLGNGSPAAQTMWIDDLVVMTNYP